MQANPKPLPVLAGLAGEYYEWCRRGELRFQRCRHCGGFRHVPREICAGCGSFDWDWVKGGRGTVYTWTVVARALHPGFAGDEPYAPAVIEMEEGVRVLSQVRDCPPEQLRVGMPVRVEFVAVNEQVTLIREETNRWL